MSVDASNFVLRYLLKDQPGLTVSPGHSQEEGVSLPSPTPHVGACSQPRRPVCCTQGDAGGREGAGTLPAQTDHGLE